VEKCHFLALLSEGNMLRQDHVLQFHSRPLLFPLADLRLTVIGSDFTIC